MAASAAAATTEKLNLSEWIMPVAAVCLIFIMLVPIPGLVLDILEARAPAILLVIEHRVAETRSRSRAVAGVFQVFHGLIPKLTIISVMREFLDVVVRGDQRHSFERIGYAGWR